MSDENLIPIYHGSFEDCSLLKAFLESDGLSIKLIPDVTSEPLQSPGAHNIRSLYTAHVVLVAEAEKERAEELKEAFLSEE